jgi:diguanylate cyclase (GGDEF)-like protein
VAGAAGLTEERPFVSHEQPRSPSGGAPGDADAQTLSDLDQSTADGDQTSSDLDQTYSDVDRTASDRDQRASDRDQDAADNDQAAGADADTAGYDRSRRARSQSSAERDLTMQARVEISRLRDEAAARRDRLAADRDAAAHARDALAAALDAEIERLDGAGRGQNDGPVTGMDLLLHAADDRKRAAASRARAAEQRAAAATDRERADGDRRRAALDRVSAAEELALEGFDHLTGALRRGVGLAAIQREMDRTRRTEERLVVAFIDVDGLKKVNDTRGHAAGDELLNLVARCVKQHLRSYDVMARFGGDEFVCSLSGQDVAGARRRFDQIAIELAQPANHAKITVGFAERQPDDSLDGLIQRADRAMLEMRRRPDA